MKTCKHETKKDASPTSDVCQQCVDNGDSWVALRKCTTCGNVGCCDSSAGHARKHFEETNHPIITPLTGGWKWCYLDDDYVE